MVAPAAVEPAVVAPAAGLAAAETAAPVGEETIFTVGNVQAKFDPVQNDYYDIKNPNNRAKELADFADPPLGMYRGGPVRGYNMGGRVTIADLARYYGMGR